MLEVVFRGFLASKILTFLFQKVGIQKLDRISISTYINETNDNQKKKKFLNPLHAVFNKILQTTLDATVSSDKKLESSHTRPFFSQISFSSSFMYLCITQ